ncbi:glycosyltransferase family 2 protein [Patescibacteria group bacterium]|nr:glycosyltransferase family 2 protein [Patescibacteria group bacterium]MBU4265148.1 glycosyltransferase family 2 protein [Patescibacteria group bacterium]MBU4390712.1 glycosyltransferase family 2 protein [Patescibacteria group bacterium]MBU4396871.1 glycosyltransferase family 2 protein [Patescibacteria group bacterium]MBU4431120.1 glycosyltransferase family 2 protein [Patescibacteria group bacterium]
MDLSIIILNWNTPKATINCIKSIFKYIKDIKHEIIVADNASTDNSVNQIKKTLIHRHPDHPQGGEGSPRNRQKQQRDSSASPQNDVKIQLIQNSSNFGFAKGNNIASKKAKGDYLLFLNSDMKLVDSSIVNMLQFLQKSPKVGAIGPQFLNPNKTPQASVFPKQSILNAFKEFWLGQKYAFTKNIPKDTTPSSVYAISGGAFLISKKLFDQLGKWNEKYFMYFEDLDLCRRIHKSVKQVYCYPQCKVIHYHGLSGKSLSNSENQWRRLIPSSKIYHGLLKHYLLTLIIWLSSKCHKK